MDRRIGVALVSTDPTGDRPAEHGAPTHVGLLRGVKAEEANYRPPGLAWCVRDVALHIAYWQNQPCQQADGGSDTDGLCSA